MRNRLLLLLSAICLGTISSVFAENKVTFDFESGDLQGWRVVEGKFDHLVSDRKAFHNGGKPYNKQGTYYLSTVE